MADFLAAVLAKTLMAMLEALIMRLVHDLFVAGLRQHQQTAVGVAPAF